MNSRRRISALQIFEGKTITIRDAMEPVLLVSAWGRPSRHVRLGIVEDEAHRDSPTMIRAREAEWWCCPVRSSVDQPINLLPISYAAHAACSPVSDPWLTSDQASGPVVSPLHS
jgi:hypothetical protein